MTKNSKLSAILQTFIPGAYAQEQIIPGTDIRLYLINSDYPQHALSQEVALQIMERPLYWAFCWASGAVLARYLLENKTIVENKTVIDFGSGSGVVAIAAAKAGAKKVIACDCDGNALAAVEENALINGVKIACLDDINKYRHAADILLAADVLYDRENFPMLDEFLSLANTVMVADSRIKNFDHLRYCCIGEQEACTWPDLDEAPEFRCVKIYQSLPQQL